MVHLRLLPTPPRGDAVTFNYRPESAGLEGTCTPLIEYTFRRTSQGREPLETVQRQSSSPSGAKGCPPYNVRR